MLLSSWFLRFFRLNQQKKNHKLLLVEDKAKLEDHHRLNNDEDDEDDNVVAATTTTTKLTETEIKMLHGGMAPISTITWFRFEEEEEEESTRPTTTTATNGHNIDRESNNTTKKQKKKLDSITSILHLRIHKILQKNPWLMGRFIIEQQQQQQEQAGSSRWWKFFNQSKQKNAYLQYSNKKYTSEEIDQYIKENNILHEINDDNKLGIHRHSPISDIAKTLTKYNILLRAKRDCDQPLWKVIILLVPPCCSTEDDQDSNSDSSFFAIIFSMSHIAGDGHTFYKLYNSVMMMKMNNDSSVTPLNPQRIETTMEQQQEAMGGITESRIFQLPGFIYTILKGVFVTKFIAPIPWFGRQFRAQTRYYYLNPNAIQHAKKDAIIISNINNITKSDDDNDDDNDSSPDAVSFVSTNDIITSWFLMNSKCHIGRMAINFRNRLEGHTDNRAGNYENAILYRVPYDVSNPIFIRKSILSKANTQPVFKRIITSNQPPSSIDFYNSNLSLISNWSSFASHEKAADFGPIDDDRNEKEGSDECVIKQELHVPLFDVTSLLPTTLALCIIFQAQPNRLGIMLTATPHRMSKLIGSHTNDNNDNLLLLEESMI